MTQNCVQYIQHARLHHLLYSCTETTSIQKRPTTYLESGNETTLVNLLQVSLRKTRHDLQNSVTHLHQVFLGNITNIDRSSERHTQLDLIGE